MLASPALLYSLWATVIVAEAAVFTMIVARKVYRCFPAFTGFVGFCVLRSLLLVGLNITHRGLYSTVYWLAYVPQLVLVIALTLEIFNFLFR